MDIPVDIEEVEAPDHANTQASSMQTLGWTLEDAPTIRAAIRALVQERVHGVKLAQDLLAEAIQLAQRTGIEL